MSILDSCLVALCGFLVVLVMLAMLALAITVISKVFVAIENKRNASAPAPVAAPVAAPTAAPAGGTYTGEVALIDVDEKTAACVMAIVSHETGIALSELIFKKIKLVAATEE